MADINELISKEALKSVNDLEATFARVITTVDKLIAESKSLDILLSAMNKMSTAQENLKNVSKKALDINKQLRDSEDEIVKGKIRFANANKEQRNTLSALVTLESEQAGTLEKLTARNKLLREEQRKLNLETENGIKRNKEINSELNKNTKFIRDNSDSLVKNKMNVGNYAQSIGQAAGSLVGFTSVAAAAYAMVNQLKEAFNETESGAKFTKTFTEVKKTFFQGIVDKPGRFLTSLIPGFGIVAEKEIQLELAKTEAIAKKMDEVRKGDRQDLIEIAKMEDEIVQLRFKSNDVTKSEAEQRQWLEKAQEKENELIAYKIKDKQEELDLVKLMLTVRKGDTDLLDQQAQLEAEIIGFESDRNLRLESRRTSLLEKELNDKKKSKEQAQKDAEEAFNNEVQLKKANLEVTKQIDDEALSQQTDIEKEFLSSAADQSKSELDIVSDQVNKELELQQQKFEEEIKMTADAEKEKSRLKQEIFSSSFDLLNSVVQNSSNKQLSLLQKQQDAELKAAGDNAEQKDKINQKYEKKRIDIERKAAIREKALALFQIAVETAKGVVKATAGIVTVGLVPYIIATGAIQAAIVASKPLPQYAKGTRYSGAGPAIVGEQGRELMISPSGNVSLTGDGAELVNLQRGTKIIPSDETSMILRAAIQARGNNSEAIQERRHRELIKAINEKETLIMPSSVGQPITMRQGNRYKTYFNRHLQ